MGVLPMKKPQSMDNLISMHYLVKSCSTSYNYLMKIDINHLSKLANLNLSDKEKKSYSAQLESTLEHVERLQEIDTSGVEGTNEVTALKNIWREDEIKPSLSQKEALMNAQNTYNGFFVVPAILEENN